MLCRICLLLISLIGILLPQAYAGGMETKADQGKRIFQEYCAVCHGEKGDGNGQVCFVRNREKSGRVLVTYPRDFTAGSFKFRTTPTGCLPTDDDLLKTVTNGISKSSMPTFKDIPTELRKAVIAHIKTFSPRWKEEEPCKTVRIAMPAWVATPASIDKGKAIFKDMKCWECHGEDGKGSGPKSKDLKDDWGRTIVPFDFTTGKLKRGTSPENIYITFTTGLDGTGMPSYEDSLKDEERWHLVSYTMKLMGLTK
ncbi:MAG: cytochrome c [Nitrospirae bacterium]|nr:cytochrome c [Nitrospirota bacterium]